MKNPNNRSRRNLIKSTILGGGVIGGKSILPDQWTKPVIDSVVLPSHGDTTNPGTIEVEFFGDITSQIAFSEKEKQSLIARLANVVITEAEAQTIEFNAYLCIAAGPSVFHADLSYVTTGDIEGIEKFSLVNAPLNAFSDLVRDPANPCGPIGRRMRFRADTPAGGNIQWAMEFSESTIGGFLPATPCVNYVAGGECVGASDVNIKENFGPVDTNALLQKVVNTPVRYQHESGFRPTRHLSVPTGVFNAMFSVSQPDQPHPDLVDINGVSMAAIKGLDNKLKSSDRKLQDLEAKLTELKSRVS